MCVNVNLTRGTTLHDFIQWDFAFFFLNEHNLKSGFKSVSLGLSSEWCVKESINFMKLGREIYPVYLFIVKKKKVNKKVHGIYVWCIHL